MELDIERLHAVVSGEVTGKKVGSTTAKIEEIISCIQLRNCRCVIVTTVNMCAIREYTHQLLSRAQDLGFSIDWFSVHAGYINDIVVRFKLKNESLNGYDDYYLVEMDY